MSDFLQSWKVSFLDVHRQVDEMFEELIYRRWAITNPNAWCPVAPPRVRLGPGLAPKPIPPRLPGGEA